ncbi:MAG: hypothetical protein AAB215_07005, partial [Planctomycetota bacterium]
MPDPLRKIDCERLQRRLLVSPRLQGVALGPLALGRKRLLFLLQRFDAPLDFLQRQPVALGGALEGLRVLPEALLAHLEHLDLLPGILDRAQFVVLFRDLVAKLFFTLDEFRDIVGRLLEGLAQLLVDLLVLEKDLQQGLEGLDDLL